MNDVVKAALGANDELIRGWASSRAPLMRMIGNASERVPGREPAVAPAEDLKMAEVVAVLKAVSIADGKTAPVEAEHRRELSCVPDGDLGGAEEWKPSTAA